MKNLIAYFKLSRITKYRIKIFLIVSIAFLLMFLTASGQDRSSKWTRLKGDSLTDTRSIRSYFQNDSTYKRGIWLCETSDGHYIISSKAFELSKKSVSLWEKERVSSIRSERVIEQAKANLWTKDQLITSMQGQLGDVQELRVLEQTEFEEWKAWDQKEDRRKKRRNTFTIGGLIVVATVQTVLLIVTNVPLQ